MLLFLYSQCPPGYATAGQINLVLLLLVLALLLNTELKVQECDATGASFLYRCRVHKNACFEFVRIYNKRKV